VKIAFVTQPSHSVLPPAGSLEIWTREVGKRLVARGHDVVVYASATEGVVPGAHDGIEFRFVQHALDRALARLLRPLYRVLPAPRPFFSSRLFPLAYWARVAARLRAEEVDVVHVFNYSQALPLLRRLVPRAALVLHMQCEWLTQLAPGMVDRRLRHADLVLGCSDAILDKARAAFPHHAHRCVTVHNGVDVDRLGRVRDSVDRSGHRLLFVSRISPEKGVHVLIEAFNRLAETDPDVELTLVGDDAVIPLQMAVRLAEDEVVRELERFYESDYRQTLVSLLSPAAARRVTFTGGVPYDDVAQQYERADIFVLPSLLEAFGMPAAEAMAAGLPVVASRSGGIVEIVADGETGLLVPPDDAAALAEALLTLFRDPDRRIRMGAAGRACASDRFSWDRITGETEDAFGRARARSLPG